MLTWAAVLFALAALGGVYMLVLRIRGRMPSLGVALLHGVAAAVALVLLAVVVIGGGAAGGLLTASLLIFVLAALGGFALLATHLQGGEFPVVGTLAHGGAAVVGFILLLIALF